MMRKLKELYSGPMKLAFSILWIYLFVVFSFQTISVNAEYSFPFAVSVGAVSFAFTYCVFYFGGTLVCKVNTPAREWDKRSLRIVVGVIFGITFLFFCGYFLCQYPGGSSPDVVSQYSQALSGTYNNWHPALHTLLFFTLPLNLTSLGFPLVVFLQILYFCLAFAYLMSVLLRNGINPPFAVLFCVFVWINPYLATYLMYPWKDLALMIFAVILIAQYIQIVCTNGGWLEKKTNLAAFSVVSVLCMYMRHNALLLVVPIVVFSMIYARKNKRVVIGAIAVMAICILFVQGLYAVLNVEKPDKRTLETVGLPATIWCGVMQMSPQALPEDTREIMYEIATQEQYETNYIDGDFNSIKWAGANNAVIDEMSYAEVLKYTIQCIVYSPQESLEAFTKLTDIVWGTDEIHASFRVNAPGDYAGVNSSSQSKLWEYFNQYKSLFGSSRVLKAMFGSYGIQMIVLLVVGTVLLAKKRISIIHTIPLFCYNFGTMLFLSGKGYRFFLYNIPVWLAVLFLMVKDRTVFESKRFQTKSERAVLPEGQLPAEDSRRV